MEDIVDASCRLLFQVQKEKDEGEGISSFSEDQIAAAQELQFLTVYTLKQCLGYGQKTKKYPNPKHGVYIEEYLAATCMVGSQSGGGDETETKQVEEEEEEAADDVQDDANDLTPGKPGAQLGRRMHPELKKIIDLKMRDPDTDYFRDLWQIHEARLDEEASGVWCILLFPLRNVLVEYPPMYTTPAIIRISSYTQVLFFFFFGIIVQLLDSRTRARTPRQKLLPIFSILRQPWAKQIIH